MERDPNLRHNHGLLLPKQFCVTEYYVAASQEHRLVVPAEQDYQVEPYLRRKLESQGAILSLAGMRHPSGAIEFTVPEGVDSLSAFLNSTSADTHREWKRHYMFSRISEFLGNFTQRGLGLEANPAATRYNIGQNNLSDPILLPANPISITPMNQHAAHAKNKAFFEQIQRDIIDVAPPDERDFPF